MERIGTNYAATQTILSPKERIKAWMEMLGFGEKLSSKEHGWLSKCFSNMWNTEAAKKNPQAFADEQLTLLKYMIRSDYLRIACCDFLSDKAVDEDYENVFAIFLELLNQNLRACNRKPIESQENRVNYENDLSNLIKQICFKEKLAKNDDYNRALNLWCEEAPNEQEKIDRHKIAAWAIAAYEQDTTTLKICGSSITDLPPIPPRLISLRIEKCDNLKEITNNLSQLTDLRISECFSLETINAKFGQLKDLKISFCHSLIRIILQQSVANLRIEWCPNFLQLIGCSPGKMTSPNCSQYTKNKEIRFGREQLDGSNRRGQVS